MIGRIPDPSGGKRPSKKTDAVEVRVSPEDKAAFMAACEARGELASEVLRTAMRRYSGGPPKTRRVLMALSAIVTAAAAFWAGASRSPDAGAPPTAEVAQAGEIETRVELALFGAADKSLQSRIVSASGEAAEIVIDDIDAHALEPVFGPLGVETAALVLVFTATADTPDSVVYRVMLNARAGDRMLLPQPLNPVLVVRRGEPAKIEIANAPPVGGLAGGLSISLTPSPGV